MIIFEIRIAIHTASITEQNSWPFVIWEWALWFSRIWPVPQPHDAVRAVTGAPPLDAEQLRSLADRLSIGFVLNLLSCVL